MIYLFYLLLMAIVAALVGAMAYCVVSLILVIFVNLDTNIGRKIKLVTSISVAVITFVGVIIGEIEAKTSFKKGETITTTVKRVDWNNGEVYILTEDSKSFSAYEKEYMLLTPGDTLTYRLYADGVRTKILSVKHSDEEYHQKKVDEVADENNDGGIMYLYYAGQSSPTPMYY